MLLNFVMKTSVAINSHSLRSSCCFPSACAGLPNWLIITDIKRVDACHLKYNMSPYIASKQFFWHLQYWTRKYCNDDGGILFNPVVNPKYFKGINREWILDQLQKSKSDTAARLYTAHIHDICPNTIKCKNIYLWCYFPHFDLICRS